MKQTKYFKNTTYQNYHKKNTYLLKKLNPKLKLSDKEISYGFTGEFY